MPASRLVLSLYCLLALSLLAAAIGCAFPGAAQQAPTATLAPPTVAPMPTRTPTYPIALLFPPTTTPTAAPEATASPTPSRGQVPTAAPSLDATREPTLSRTPSLTRAPTQTRTPSPTRTASRTRTSTRTPTGTRTRTPTRTPTCTRTPSVTRTPSLTRTPTCTRTPTEALAGATIPSPMATAVGSDAATTETPTAQPAPAEEPTLEPTTAPPAPSPAPHNDVHIADLQPAGKDEWIEVANNGPGDQDLTGWRIESVVGPQWYNFPGGYVLAAGAHVRIHSGPEAVGNPPHDLKWSGNYVWNDAGDEAKLYDEAGNVRDGRRYP